MDRTTLSPGAMNVSMCVEPSKCGSDDQIHFLVVCVKKTLFITFAVVAGLLAGTCFLCGVYNKAKRRRLMEAQTRSRDSTSPWYMPDLMVIRA